MECQWFIQNECGFFVFYTSVRICSLAVDFLKKLMSLWCYLSRKKKSKGKKVKKESSSSGSGSDNDVEVIKVWNSRSRGGGEGNAEELVNNPPSVNKSDEGELNVQVRNIQVSFMLQKAIWEAVRDSALLQNGRFLNAGSCFCAYGSTAANNVLVPQEQGASG